MDSKPEKKTEQEKLLELQMNVAPKARIPDILTLATALLIIFALAVLMFVTPDKTFSEQENRYNLQLFPAISTKGKFLDRLVEGKFTSEMATYYSDQFPFRDAFVGIKGIAEIGMLKGENNGVILGKDDYLITKDPPAQNASGAVALLSGNIDGIAAFADVMNQMQISVTLAAAGRTIDAMTAYLPAAYPKTNSTNLWNSFNGLADIASNVKRLNLLDPLRQLIEKGDRGQLYYKTDHHWTTRGAYYAYAEIIKSFKEDDIEPLPLSAFTIEAASAEFYGTTWSKAGMKWIKPDTMEYYRYDGDEDFVTTIVDTGNSFSGFYDRSYLGKKDKYSSFISGNNSRVEITKPNEPNRPKMLVIKDSFAHAVIPFLAYHFDLVILDIRYFKSSAAKLVFEEGIDRVLFLHNIGNLSEANLYGVDKGDISGSILLYGAEDALKSYTMAQYPIKGIYINENPIDGYVIVIPTEQNDSRKYYADAAEKLRFIILERAGVELEIVKTDDISGLDKYILLTNEGLPAAGCIKIATEGNNLAFRCNIGSDSAGYAVNLFIEKYLKKSTGSFNFGGDYIYSDIGEDVIMIKPARD